MLGKYDEGEIAALKMSRKNKYIANIRVKLQLPGSLRFPATHHMRKKFILFRQKNLVVSLINRDLLREAREEAWKVVNVNSDQVKIRKARRVIGLLNRLFTAPFVQLDILNCTLLPSDLPQKDQRILINGKKVRQSMWFTAAAEAVSVYNTTIYCLYQIFPKENFLSCLIEPISLDYMGTGTAFPSCLSLWKASVRIGDAPWISNLSFEIVPPGISLEPEAIGKFTDAEFNNRLLLNFRRLLKTVDPLVPKWPLGWQYLFFAERHHQENNLRVAIIDLDLAGSIIARDWLKIKTKLPENAFDKLSQRSSTSDFLNAASFLCCNKKELSCIEDLKALHNLRNTILHQHQRSFGRQHKQIFTKAKDAVIFLSNTSNNQKKR